jgi:putative transposase
MSGYDPEKHHRRSIRLKGYDYSQPGAYFITIVIQNCQCLLDPEPIQEIVRYWWNRLPVKFPTVETDAFVMMPNHIHGIIMIMGAVGADLGGSTRGSTPTEADVVGADLGGSTRGSTPTEADAVGADLGGSTRGSTPTGVDPVGADLGGSTRGSTPTEADAVGACCQRVKSAPKTPE